MKIHQNVPVVPYVELLDSTRGLSDHNGGPIFEDWDNEVASRHCRRGNQPIDRRPDVPATRARRLEGSWSWIGPVCHHFGHQLADFSMRLLPARAGGHRGGYLAAVRVGQSASLQQTPAFFRDILDYCGIELPSVHLIAAPVEVAELAVWPQAETIFGPPPDPSWLDTLERHSRWRLSAQARPPAHRVVYVTRSNIPRGTIAGEAAIEQWLRHHGALVVHPELHSLSSLLALYCVAEHVVISEGSAMHALQFLGRQLPHVTIIGRGQSVQYGKNFLAPRCRSLLHLDVVACGLSGRPDGRYRETGLAFLDGPALVEQLGQRLRVGSDGWSASDHQMAQRASIARWLSEYVHAKPHLPSISPDVLEAELAALGMPLDPAVRGLLIARRLQQRGDRIGAALQLQHVFDHEPTAVTAALALEEAVDAQAPTVASAVLAGIAARSVAESARLVLAEARALEVSGRAAEALERVKALLLARPKADEDARCLTLLSALALRLAAPAIARQLMQRAGGTGGLTGWMLRHWAQLEAALQEHDRALALAAEALALNPQDSEAEALLRNLQARSPTDSGHIQRQHMARQNAEPPP